jgi:hypothetical protein
MATSDKSSAWKIVLIVVGALFVLGILCCAGAWFLMGDEVMDGVKVGMGVAKLDQRLDAELEQDVVVGLHQKGPETMVLTIGVRDELTEERVRELQDAVWKAYCDVFADGGMPVRHVGVGRPSGSSEVSDWREHQVSVEELEQRTGRKAPPPLELFDWGFGEDE